MSTTRSHTYSIIIPTFNRAGELRELLQSLSLLDFPRDRFEVILSDDGSTDSTRELAIAVQKQNVYHLRYIRQKNQGPGAARNLAMEKALGSFFIFVDSDVTMPADWLKKIDAELSSSEADAFGGPDTFHEEFPPLLKAINYSMTSFLLTGGLRGRKGKKLAKFYPRSFNMGLSRELWQKIGGFGALRHGQDIEYSHRIIKSGARVVFVDAPVYHKRRTNLRRFFKQVFNWGVARINLYKIDRKMLEPLHALPAVATLLIILVCLLAPFNTIALNVFYAGFTLACLGLIFSLIDAIIMYRSFRPALWLPLVMPAQVLGYGLGFLYNFTRRVILGKGAHSGFRKNYYK